ncbi:MAG: hypothetical protein AB7O32_05515 [Vicinamibacterales bacterium]
MADTIETARARVERELQERLARTAGDTSGAEAQAARPAATEAVRVATIQRTAPVATIALRCLACQAIVDSDARFCTACGVRFNAQIVVRELVGRTTPEQAS